jgi:hypothetical protein
MLAAKSPERRIHLSRTSAHDRRSAMGENGLADPYLPAPHELLNDRGVADPHAIPFAHH